MLGSCFAESMGARLRYFQFRGRTNPFGVIYHPGPLLSLLQRAAEQQPFTEGDLFYNQGLWRTLQAHSSLAHPEKAIALDALNQALRDLGDSMEGATHCILTLGSARGYRHLESGRLAANCQKLPPQDFKRELSSSQELLEYLDGIFGILKGFSKNCQVILTVSPVRHIRDGLVENQLSKARLLDAAHTACQRHGGTYFPAYEILLDELRDYRFYDRDLVHPSQSATDHIWDRFSEAWIGAAARPDMKEVEAVQKALAHKPLHPDSGAHEAFKKSLGKRIAYLLKKHPHMKFES